MTEIIKFEIVDLNYKTSFNLQYYYFFKLIVVIDFSYFFVFSWVQDINRLLFYSTRSRIQCRYKNIWDNFLKWELCCKI